MEEGGGSYGSLHATLTSREVDDGGEEAYYAGYPGIEVFTRDAVGS